MNDDGGAGEDRDLLARLNALKKSGIHLDQKIYSTSHVPPAEPAIDPHPARSLHTDLLDRFKSLTGKESPAKDDAAGLEKSEDDKTIEELLADLGPAEQWNVGKSEYDLVEELLSSANVTLAKGPDLERVPEGEDETAKATAAPALPSIDVTAFQLEPESDEDTMRPSKHEAQRAIDQEADEVVKRALDEVELEKQENLGEDNGEHANADNMNEEKHVRAGFLPEAGFDLPTVPSKEVEPSSPNSGAVASNDDDDLAVRFASLSLPNAPTTIQSKTTVPKSEQAPGFTDKEVDSWCIICNDDATLSCIGCDGDLYCTNCWLEGHRGVDAGYEEKTHKAIQYVKGKKKQKTSQRKVMMGA